jgi:hypothetical protein
MAKFQLEELVRTEAVTYRGGPKATPITDNDVGKAVKLSAANEVDLAGADDEIFGFVSSVEPGTLDGFRIVGVKERDFKEVDTGSVPVGTLAVVASNPAKGTAGKTVVKAAGKAGDTVQPDFVDIAGAANLQATAATPSGFEAEIDFGSLASVAAGNTLKIVIGSETFTSTYNGSAWGTFTSGGTPTFAGTFTLSGTKVTVLDAAATAAFTVTSAAKSIGAATPVAVAPGIYKWVVVRPGLIKRV